MGTRRPIPGDIAGWDDQRFTEGLEKLDMEGVVELVRVLQQEMAEEQEDFNAFKEELAECDSQDTRRSEEITELMVESQARLGSLMDRMGQCFQSQEARTNSSGPEKGKATVACGNVSSLRQRSPSPQQRAPSPGQRSASPSVFKSHQVYTSAQLSKNNDEPSQNHRESAHTNNLVKLNQLVSSHKGSLADAHQSRATADKSHSAANGEVVRNVKTILQVAIDVPAGNLKSRAEGVKKPEENSVRVPRVQNDTTDSAERNVSKTERTVIQTTIPNIQISQSVASDTEPVKLRSHVKASTPIKRLSVSEARNLFENQSSGNQHPVRRSSSRGSVNQEQNKKSLAPWVREEQERAASLVDLRQTGNSPVDQCYIGMEKNSAAFKVTDRTAPNQPNKPMSFVPKVKKAWEQPGIINNHPKNASKQTLQNKQGVLENERTAPETSGAVCAVTMVHVTPKQAIQPREVVQNQAKQTKPSSTKTVTKVTLRTNESKQPPLLPSKNLLRNITNAKLSQSRGGTSSHVVIQDEEPTKFAIQLKPVGARTPKSGVVRKTSNTPAPAPQAVELKTPDERVPVALTSPITLDSEGFTADEKVQERVTLKDWDPTVLLKDVYELTLHPDSSEGEMTYVNMEGYMEKLPLNKKKATLLKTWKKRYFKAFNGNLYYYESAKFKKGPEDLEKATGCLPLGGGNLEHLGDKMLGIDDGRGRYLVVRCLSEKDYNKWTGSLTSQIATDVKVKWVRPFLSSQLHPNKKVVVIDIGSCSVRAGILGEAPSLPQLFFPTVVAIDRTSKQESVGFEVAKPQIRANSDVNFPVRPSIKVDKFSLNMEVMPAIFRHVFKELRINPKDYWVMFSAPANFTDKIKEQFMNMLINSFNVHGVNIVNQTLLALYSYNSMSGIVVDIGERLEIVPVTDGYIVEQGVSRQPYGGQAITQALNSTFTEKRYRFFTDVEFQIVRLAMEKMCFVSENYSETLKDCNKNPTKYRKIIDMAKYELPKGSWTHVTNDVGRFKSTEGLFNLEVWGMDNPPLHRLIQSAVQASPMDTRREMWRSIYLSGGVTLLPGFVERLEKEVLKLAPPSVPVEIHASPQRYHAAFIGACALAGMSVFEQSCISANEWNKQGPSVLRKWHMY